MSDNKPKLSDMAKLVTKPFGLPPFNLTPNPLQDVLAMIGRYRAEHTEDAIKAVLAGSYGIDTDALLKRVHEEAVDPHVGLSTVLDSILESEYGIRLEVVADVHMHKDKVRVWRLHETLDTGFDLSNFLKGGKQDGSDVDSDR